MKRLIALFICLSLAVLPSCGFVSYVLTNENSETEFNGVSFTYSEPEFKSFTPELNDDGEPLVILDYEVNANDMYYRSCLTEHQRKIYDIIATAVANHEASVITPNGTGGPSGLDDIISAYHYDHPETIYWNGDIIYSENIMQGTITIEFNYLLDKETTERYLSDIKEAEEKYLSYITADMTQYDAAVIIHDLLCNNIEYPSVIPETITEIYTLFGALVNKSAVCSGYAHAFKYLCNKVGINVISIEGTADDEDHQWNMVTIGEDSFFVDVTWDDPLMQDGSQSTNYAYFGLTNKELAKTHSITGSFSLPTCKSTEYNYCEKYGFVINDEAEASDILVKALNFTVKEKPEYIENTYQLCLKINTDTCNYDDTCDIIIKVFPDVINSLAYTTLVKFSTWSLSCSYGEDSIPYITITLFLE